MLKLILFSLVSGCALFTHPLPQAATETWTVTARYDGWTVWTSFASDGWRQERIVTPAGTVFTGAPFGLKCELSYRCLVQTLIRLRDTVYLVGDSQVYRYDAARERFELLIDVDGRHFGPSPEATVYMIYDHPAGPIVGALVFTDHWQVEWQ